jgi:hypothetical protein
MPTQEEMDPAVLRLKAETVGVPEHLINSLVAYVAERQPTGDCLRAVLENDLKGAFGRADEETAFGMKRILMWLYNYTPSICYGSPARVAAWLAGES